jgi:hypothetical protein
MQRTGAQGSHKKFRDDSSQGHLSFWSTAKDVGCSTGIPDSPALYTAPQLLVSSLCTTATAKAIHRILELWDRPTVVVRLALCH